MPISRRVRITRTAISPRLAIRTLRNMQMNCNSGAARIGGVCRFRYGPGFNGRISKATGSPAYAPAADSARADRSDGRASGRRAAVPDGQGEGPETEPGHGVSHPQNAEAGRAGG